MTTTTATRIEPIELDADDPDCGAKIFDAAHFENVQADAFDRFMMCLGDAMARRGDTRLKLLNQRLLAAAKSSNTVATCVGCGADVELSTHSSDLCPKCEDVR